MQIRNLLIPETKYTHHWPPQANIAPAEITSDAQTISVIYHESAFCSVVTIVCDEKIIVLSSGSGHSTSLSCHLQSADSANELIFEYKYLRRQAWEEARPAIHEQIASLITHPEIYKQNKDLILNFIKEYCY